jgi:hypothetical protein
MSADTALKIAADGARKPQKTWIPPLLRDLRNDMRSCEQNVKRKY